MLVAGGVDGGEGQAGQADGGGGGAGGDERVAAGDVVGELSLMGIPRRVRQRCGKRRILVLLPGGRASVNESGGKMSRKVTVHAAAHRRSFSPPRVYNHDRSSPVRGAAVMPDPLAAFYLALEESPGDPVTLQALADWYEEQGQTDDAACLRWTVRQPALPVPLPPRRRPERQQSRRSRTAGTGGPSMTPTTAATGATRPPAGCRECHLEAA